MTKPFHHELLSLLADAFRDEADALIANHSVGGVGLKWTDQAAREAYEYADRVNLALDALVVRGAVAPGECPAQSDHHAELRQALEATLEQCLAWQGEPNQYSCDIHAGVVSLARAALRNGGTP